MTHDKIRHIPLHRNVTYAQIICGCQIQKPDPNRVHITSSEILINYPDELDNKTVDLMIIKLLWDSIIRKENLHFMFIDI